MGILNATPDSFYEPSRIDAGNVVDRVRDLLSKGVSIIDIGAESTRPGAEPVGEKEEYTRLLSVLEPLSDARKRGALPSDLLLSIDTYRSGVVRRVYDFWGPFIVNDISAGENDPEMLPLVASLGLTYVAMHKRGDSKTMDSLTDYPDGVVKEVKKYFTGFAAKADGIGIKNWILDPGFGFAKTEEQNVELLCGLSEFKVFGRPLLVGISHKRFTRGHEQEFRELAVMSGADIIREHI